MSINNLPATIQAAIQTGMLRRAFEIPLEAMLGFRSIADQEPFPAEIGETLTRTRPGLLPAVTSAMPPANNTDFTSGLTPQNWPIEQYTLSVQQYAANMMLNIVTSRVAIDSIYLQNAAILAEQAGRSIDILAQQVLFKAYMGGSTSVLTTLGAASTTLHVDNIQGFETTINSDGLVVPVSSSAPVNATVGADVYSCIGAVADSTNVSVAPGGISGTLTFSSSVSVSDGTAGNAVVSAIAPYTMRPLTLSGGVSGPMVTTTAGISSSGCVNNGRLTMEMILQAKAQLAANGVRGVRGDSYRLFVDPIQATGLYNDNAFQLLYMGQDKSREFRRGIVSDILGVEIIETNLNPVQTTANGNVRRGLLVGQGALIEGTYTMNGYMDAVGGNDPDLFSIFDGIAHITREPLDALKQVVTQSWTYIGGFVVPTDITATPTTIPTASNARYKRGVILESL